MSQVSQLYDTLFSFESSRHDSPYPIHKRLKLDEAYSDLLDWLLDHVNVVASDHILDAGCGTGYSLIKLGKEMGISGKGISLAKQEIGFAKQQAVVSNLDQHIEFEVASFENPLTEKYDKILAIESIKHVADVEGVLANLVDGLNEGGTLIIADDFVLEETNGLIDRHKKLWNVPGFDMVDRTISSLKQQELVVHQFELTDLVPRRSSVLLMMLIGLIRFFLKITARKHRLKIEIYLGGLLLEQLYNFYATGYYVLIARKP